MVSFKFTVKDAEGIHARPAGQLVKHVNTLGSTVEISFNGKVVGAKKLLALMGLGVKCGNEIEVIVNGETEAADAESIKAFLEANL